MKDFETHIKKRDNYFEELTNKIHALERKFDDLEKDVTMVQNESGDKENTLVQEKWIYLLWSRYTHLTYITTGSLQQMY